MRFEEASSGRRHPPKRNSLAWHLQQLLDLNSELHQQFAPPAPHLSRERAQQLSEKRWLAKNVAQAAALKHVQGLQFPSRAAAAREILEFL